MYEFGENNGAIGFRNGNAIMSNWTACYTTCPRLTLLTEVNYSYMVRASLGGVTATDTGGTTLCVTPGLQYRVAPATELLAAYQLPVVTHLYGDQLKPADLLAVGVRRVF